MPEPLVIARRLIGQLLPYKRQALAAYGSLLFVTVLTLAVPWLIRWVIDIGYGTGEDVAALPGWLPLSEELQVWASAQQRGLLLWAAALVVGLAVARGFFAFVQIYLGSWLSQHVAYDLRNRYFRHLQAMPFSFHDRTNTGDLMSRAVSDISKVQLFIGQGLLEAVYVPVLFLGAGFLLFRYDALLALLALLPILVLAGVTLRFAQVIEPRFKAVQDQEGVLSTRAQENFTGARVVKAFARERWEIERFEEDNEEFYQRRTRVIAGFADFFPLMTALVAFSIVLVLWFGGRMVLAGEMSVGTLVSINFLVLVLAQPTQNLGFLVNNGAEAVAAGRRLFEILDTQSEIVSPSGAEVLGPLEGRLRFRDVSSGYGGEDVLHDLDFEVAPNRVVALFGPTGSGKSSLISLIPRFYDVREGAVLVDGQDVRDVELSSLRCQVATVLQDTFLFSASVRDNIAYGRRLGGSLPTEEEIVAAAKAAHAHEFIVDMPEGYDTLIGERGITLSGGQRQRLAIARALVMRPRILILDDATSAVDTETEHLIREAMDALMRGRTTIVIAHRLLTLKHADEIIVLDDGRIEERGTHHELVTAGGLYQRIYELQLRDQEDEAELGGDATGSGAEADA